MSRTERPQVDSVSKDDVDQFVGAVIASEQHLAMVNLVLFADQHAQPFVHLGELAGSVEGDASRRLLFKRDVWPALL